MIIQAIKLPRKPPSRRKPYNSAPPINAALCWNGYFTARTKSSIPKPELWNSARVVFDVTSSYDLQRSPQSGHTGILLLPTKRGQCSHNATAHIRQRYLAATSARSEEHTSELQSRFGISYAV